MDYRDVLKNMETVSERQNEGWITVRDYEEAPYVIYSIIGNLIDSGRGGELESDDYQGISDKLAEEYHVEMSPDEVKNYILDVIGESTDTDVTEKEAPTCKKCGKKHWPFNKCNAPEKKEDDKEEGFSYDDNEDE